MDIQIYRAYLPLQLLSAFTKQEDDVYKYVSKFNWTAGKL